MARTAINAPPMATTLSEADKDRIVRMYTGQTAMGQCGLVTIAQLTGYTQRSVKETLAERGVHLHGPQRLRSLPPRAPKPPTISARRQFANRWLHPMDRYDLI